MGRFLNLFLLAAAAYQRAAAVSLSVATTGGNASSPLLYGLMFEVNIIHVISDSDTNNWEFRISTTLVCRICSVELAS